MNIEVMLEDKLLLKLGSASGKWITSWNLSARCWQAKNRVKRSLSRCRRKGPSTLAARLRCTPCPSASTRSKNEEAYLDHGSISCNRPTTSPVGSSQNRCKQLRLKRRRNSRPQKNSRQLPSSSRISSLKTTSSPPSSHRARWKDSSRCRTADTGHQRGGDWRRQYQISRQHAKTSTTDKYYTTAKRFGYAAAEQATAGQRLGYAAARTHRRSSGDPAGLLLRHPGRRRDKANPADRHSQRGRTVRGVQRAVRLQSSTEGKFFSQKAQKQLQSICYFLNLSFFLCNLLLRKIYEKSDTLYMYTFIFSFVLSVDFPPMKQKAGNYG